MEAALVEELPQSSSESYDNLAYPDCEFEVVRNLSIGVQAVPKTHTRWTQYKDATFRNASTQTSSCIADAQTQTVVAVPIAIDASCQTELEICSDDDSDCTDESVDTDLDDELIGDIAPAVLNSTFNMLHKGNFRDIGNTLELLGLSNLVDTNTSEVQIPV